MIPILDLTKQYQNIKTEVEAAVDSVLSGGKYIMGPEVEAFEQEFGSYVGVSHAISLNSGTDALHLALRALDIGPGDEVITSPFTFVATTEAIGMVGARPVFVDIDPVTFNLDPTLVEHALTTRTRAVIPIHLYGLPTEMAPLVEIARESNLAIVEDCAQAIGAENNGRKVGTIGIISCFSFFPSKNLGAYGDGGLVATNDPDLAKRLRALRVHGGEKKYHHDELGINSRLDELQAAILRVKLRHLDDWTQLRRGIGATYNRGFAHSEEIHTPIEPANCRHVYHQYTVRVKNRDEVKSRLNKAGIQTMVYYPVPLHLQAVHKNLGLKVGAFPHAEQAANDVLSLPIFPELGGIDQQQVIDRLIEVTKSPIPA